MCAERSDSSVFAAGTKLAHAESVLHPRAVIGALLFFAARVSAQAHPLSLSEAVALAVRQNPALAAAGAELEAARGAIVAARGLDDPVLTASTSLRATRRSWVPGEPVQDRAVSEIGAELSLRQPLPIGGRVGLSLQGAYGETRYEAELADATRRGSTSAQYSPAVQLSLEQPLLRGFGVDVARADRRRATLRRDLASAEREGLAAALLRDVISGYWGLAHALRELELRRASVAAAKEQLARVQANISVGKLPMSATAEIEVAIALREDSVLAAQLGVTRRELSLGRSCGLPVGERLASVEPLPRIDPEAPASYQLSATLARALAHNPQLQAARAEARARGVELEVTEDGLLPQLDVAIAGGPVGNASSSRAAYEQLVGLGSYLVMANLELTLPLGRHAARGTRDAAREGLRKAQLTAADLAGQITMGVAESVATLETARRRAAVLMPSLDAADLDLESERARFDAGRSSNFDVLRRQDAVAGIQLSLLSAQLASLQAGADLDALTGDIFDRHGVRLRGAE